MRSVGSHQPLTIEVRHVVILFCGDDDNLRRRALRACVQLYIAEPGPTYEELCMCCAMYICGLDQCTWTTSILARSQGAKLRPITELRVDFLVDSAREYRFSITVLF